MKYPSLIITWIVIVLNRETYNSLICVLFVSLFFTKIIRMEVNIIKDIYFDIQGFLRDKFKGQELIKLVRRDQVVFYMENGVYPLWNELGYDKKIIYVFLKEPTLRLFGKWRNIDTKWKNEESNK